jgi:fused signal recognition particle receptor
LEKAKEAGADPADHRHRGPFAEQAELMAELEKIVRVIRKLDPDAPRTPCCRRLDATTGQNALSQVEAFGQTVPLTGLVMTKLDGTARGGILVALAGRFGLPVHYIGVGEGENDLQAFVAADFANALVGAGEQK